MQLPYVVSHHRDGDHGVSPAGAADRHLEEWGGGVVYTLERVRECVFERVRK